MSLHRFITKIEKKEDKIICRSKDVLRQANVVLRLEIGEKVALIDQDKCYTISIEEIGKDILSGKIIDTKSLKKNTRSLTLCLSLIKKANFELAVQKAVESGATRISPIRTERSFPAEVSSTRLDKIVKEAKEQSNNLSEIQIDKTKSLQEMLDDLVGLGTKIFVADPSGEKLSSKIKSTKNCAILIGPEGGFSAKDLNLAKKYGKVISLGKTILRAETAATVATWYFANN